MHRLAYNSLVEGDSPVHVCFGNVPCRKAGGVMLERLFHLAELFDTYGMLLTEKQRRCLELHLFDDFSLAEVGEAV